MIAIASGVRARSATCLTTLLLAAACAEDSPGDAEKSVEMLAFDPSESWGGKALEEWAVEYVRWYYRPTECTDFPTDDADGSWCGRYQDAESPVFFFDRGSFGEGTPVRIDRTRCEVPAGKAILVPVASFFGDNAGMKEPLPDEEFTTVLSEVRASMRELKLRADGQEVDRLSEHGLGPVRFSYRVPPVPNRYGCDNAKMVDDVEVEPSFVVGVFVLFQPPALGQHELEYSSVLTFFERDFSFHVRNNFAVIEQSK